MAIKAAAERRAPSTLAPPTRLNLFRSRWSTAAIAAMSDRVSWVGFLFVSVGKFRSNSAPVEVRRMSKSNNTSLGQMAKRL